MTTDEEYAWIAREAYDLDALKKDPPLVRGDRFHTREDEDKRQFTVLHAASNAITGFQAMAVAPIVDGRPDLSHIVISYAGTNPEHRADLLADAQSVVGGRTGPGTQAFEALIYADAMKVRYPKASFSTTGHSLGGFLALYVAAENDWSATTFNAPDPGAVLSPRALRTLADRKAAGAMTLRNFVDVLDVIGNIAGDRTGSAIYIDDVPGKASVLDYHDLEGVFRFAEDGSILDVTATGRTLEEILQNAARTMVEPDIAPALGIVLAGVANALRNPAVGRLAGLSVSGATVTVETVGAVALAASIGGIAVELQAIKAANNALIPRMTAGLHRAKTAAASLYPWITEADIEDCIARHRLAVRDNIDASAVARVDALADDHLRIVTELSDGILRSVKHAVAHDAQWALIYSH
ncbi:hypothetical protein [Leifsonia shinshuensis]|uniref:Lipase family protein n=1 Tax=Leifsonia shinshuensis TaxID=150026 RepID=A0A7G6Y5P8_9MICO|nr:hypothetical protein [Leifsonia shinshuensis]QNE33813.1 hypothetical protein F1C12_00730 [Leifsonia shinshuensis]